MENDLTHLAHKFFSSPVSENLTGPEKMALGALSEDDSITIRNADKGGSVVVLQRFRGV